MKEYQGYYGVNFSIIINHRKHIMDFENIIEKAYHAGMITRYGKSIIYGVGAERGTWGQFANIHMKDISFFNAKESLTWFTDIYSMAQRNFGITNRKRNFYLSQLQEIEPLLKSFGLDDEFQNQWNEVKLHDEMNNLDVEWETDKKIYDWEKRTLKKEIVFADREVEIMENVTTKMMQDNTTRSILETSSNPLELLQNAFIEGTRGWTMGSTDLEILKQNGCLINQYCHRKVA